MNEAAIKNAIMQESRNIQQRINERSITRADLNAMVTQFNTSVATKRDIADLKAVLDEIRFELRAQRQILKQQSAYIDALDRDSRTQSSQLGSLWRFVQQ